ncbi:MAG: cytochrome c3 family protein, partial [Bacteroidota bacterium]
MQALERDSATREVLALTLFIHHPYREKECALCHNQNRMGSLKEPQPGLCYQCHENFGNKYHFEHGPAAGGHCTECHDPHKSKEEKLLVQTGTDLCLNC